MNLLRYSRFVALVIVTITMVIDTINNSTKYRSGERSRFFIFLSSLNYEGVMGGQGDKIYLRYVHVF